MNKIYKVMYSKVKQCAVVVSEIAKSHGHNGESRSVRKHAALTAAVLIALGSFSFTTLPTVQATDSIFSNDYVGTNYKDDNGNSYAANVTKNYHGAGAQGVGSNTLGMNAIAGKNTVTIGDRNASASQESVYIGSKYDANNQVHPSSGTAVVSVGYGSDAAGTGSIAIGSGAAADAFDNAGKGTNPDAGSQSIAIGKNAVAKQNNIAIGANSMATATASNNVSEFTGQKASKSYVSVGDGKKNSATQYRRITNVADGAADSDAATIAQLKKAVEATDASKKANIDALNIGKNLKKADGKTAAESSDIKTNEDAWGTAIGTGSIANSNTNGSGQLVTGTTVYNYVSPKAVDGKELKYISEDKSTGTNLGILDDKVSTNATDITGLKSLSNITDNGKTVIKKAAVGAVKVIAGDRITVTPDSKNLTDADTVTYTISAKNDGKVASGNSGLVSGDTVYQALQNQTKSLTYNGGWGINIDSSKKISLKNNLTTVIYDNGSSSSKDVKFNIADTAMAIGGAIFNNSGWTSYVDGKTMTINSTGRYSVRLGGINNSTTGIYSTVTGGSANVASGYASSVNGGKNNTASGKYATVIGGGYLWTEAYENGDFPDVDESIFGSDASSYRNDASGILSTIIGGYGNKASGKNSLIVGGLYNEAGNESASIFGGGGNRADGDRTTISGGANNFAVGDYSNVSGGIANTTEGRFSTISGGYGNIIVDEGPMQPNRTYYGFPASGKYGSAFGGGYNVVGGENGTAVGGGHSVVYGIRSVGLAGGSTGLGAHYALAAGYQSVVTTKGSKLLVSDKRNEFTDDYYYDNHGYAYKILGKEQNSKHLDFIPEYEDVATAVGYQATANEPDTISFGHDVGDVSGYDVKWKERTDKDEWGNINTNPDGTINDYAKKPDIIINHYDTAKYNRLVKVADGINNHDAVVMEQLRNADNVGKNAKNNVVVYKKNTNGTLQVDENGEAVIDVDASKAATEKATEQAIKDSGDAWGKALGADVFSKGTTTTTTNASTSDQLVTGKTLYDYDKPTGSTNYVKVNNTTGQNLSALDAQVKANADALDKPNHNIKYYSVKTAPLTVDGYTNEKNDGAQGKGSIAAGFVTHADGIASTVTGSYSGVINSGTAQGLDLRGAAALSYGTVNVNQNTDPTKAYSGVANSIVGQANMTTNSNAAIIYGAGNTVTDSYRPIDQEKAKAILGSTSDPKALGKAMQDAVKDSGGQVMVMGGGNVVDNAYMSQVTGVGNTVKGNQVNNDNGEWVTDTSDTAINGYDEDRSSQYNYVDGFNNEVINGKHDYVIGANNKLSGDSYDNDKVRPIKRSNRSNIVIGDNHTLTREQNTVIIGSSDTENTQTKARDAVIIGHNANATNDTGADNAVAIGRSAKATGGNAVTIGVNTSAGAESITIGSESSAISGSNIAIGRYAKVYGDKVTNAVALGKLAEAHVADGVAIGSNSIASTVAGKTGYDAQGKTHAASDADYAAWVSTDAAVSVGGADHEVKYTDKDNKEQSKIVKSTRQITNLAAGTDDTDAVNVAQLKSLQSGLTENLTGKGLKFAANSGAEYTAKLGTTVTIQGTKKKENHEYTADNLTTEIDKDGNITILMDKNMSVERLAVNGKDGENGQPGTPGSIGISGQDGKAGVGIDGKNGISIKGKDGKDGVTIKVDNGKDGKDGSEGHIGLTGRDGSSADIIIKKGYDDKDKGINGTNGVDGKDGITRIVYTDNTGEHQVATLEDGLKFKGDDDTVIAKKLNNTMEIIGGAKGDLTEGNIGVKSTTEGKLKVQLAKDLTGITSISNQTTTKVDGKDVTNGAKITLGNDGSVDVNGGKITNVGSGADASGSYTTTTNAANIGDVQKIVKDAVDSASDTTNKALAGKANIDASNIGTNLKDANGNTVSVEAQKANAEKWGSAIGTGKIEKDNGQLVTGKTVYEYNKPIAEAGKELNYVSEEKTTGQNLGALDSHVKTNADNITKNTKSIQDITNNVKNLSDNAVQYDKDSNKTKVTLGGEGGTTITNVKKGSVAKDSTDAVNGGQLWSVDQKVDANTKNITKNADDITSLKNLSNITDAGKMVIKNLAKDAVQVKAGDRIKVDEATDKKTGNKTYTISANNNGTVAKDDGNLISGDTLYKEVHVDQDGSYIRSGNTVGQNLSALDSGLKTTSDLIHTNTAGDTIQIGESSTATKIDVSGKDANGNTTGRVITGVVSDANDPNSAANVGYVNGVTAANTQQIYRDMNNAYGRLNNNINKAAAGSNALAALHPLDYDPDDKADFAVGYGHYRNANAAAVGAFYHPNENTMVNVGVSLGNGDPGFNAGVSFKIGSGSAGHQAMSKTEMAKVINSQFKEIDALKKDNADKDKRIDALEQKMAEILAKLDKNGK